MRSSKPNVTTVSRCVILFPSHMCQSAIHVCATSTPGGKYTQTYTYDGMRRVWATCGPIIYMPHCPPPRHVTAAAPHTTGVSQSPAHLRVWQVWNTIGRALVVRDVPGAAGGDDGELQGAAAVVARSAGVGQNHKTLCSCDGTVIWGVRPPELAQHHPPVSVDSTATR
jgi:hypothetical protein